MEDEAALIAQAKAGSMDAFTRLVGIHQARVRAFLARNVRDQHVADDLAQETFFSAFRSLASYEPGEAPFGVWLVGVARNWALTYLRGKTRQRNREAGAFEAALAGWKVQRLESAAGSPAQEDGRTAALEKCLASLPSHSAGIVQNFYYKGFRTAEIAREMGKREDMIRKSLQRIRQTLRDCVRRRLTLEGR